MSEIKKIAICEDETVAKLLSALNAAQAEITSLRSQLEEARRKAIEQCIATVESMREGFRSPEYATGQPDSSVNERIACTMILNNFRALLSASTEARSASEAHKEGRE